MQPAPSRARGTRMKLSFLATGLMVAGLATAGSGLALVEVLAGVGAFARASANGALDFPDHAAASAIHDPYRFAGDAQALGTAQLGPFQGAVASGLEAVRAGAERCFSDAYAGPYLQETWGAAAERCQQGLGSTGTVGAELGAKGAAVAEVAKAIAGNAVAQGLAAGGLAGGIAGNGLATAQTILQMELQAVMAAAGIAVCAGEPDPAACAVAWSDDIVNA